MNIFRGEDAEISFILKSNGIQVPLNVDLNSEEDDIIVIFAGASAAVVKQANVSEPGVSITSDARGMFKCILSEADTLLLKKGLNQNIVIHIKRNGETIIRELVRVLNVVDATLTVPVEE